MVIKGTYQGTPADKQGCFVFDKLKAGDYNIRVSFVGYEDKTIPVRLNRPVNLDVTLNRSGNITDEILVKATRAGNRTPVAQTTVDKTTIAEKDMGQDIPYLLAMTPSLVITSDAGAGIGYTNFRIRGTDVTRINVTINGIPVNDAESHGAFFVDIPDLAGSTDNIQVQRGVGTSTSGAAAFGATVNMLTNTLNKEAWAEYKTTAGSFGTWKNSVSAGTGLLKNKFAVDVRLSKIVSDGFIDRATSDLKSFFVTAGYHSEKTIIRANIFSGFEETYQAWNGVPSVRLNNDAEGMQRYRDHWLFHSRSERANQIRYEQLVNSNARTYNLYTYENEVDNYQQDYYQLHFSHKFNQAWNINAALHYVYGHGYFENFVCDARYKDFLMTAPSEGAVTDLVRQKWLDNDFYGAIFSLNYEKGKSALTFGGGYSVYDGDHYGKVIWAATPAGMAMNHEWYRGTGLKKDFNVYGKYIYQLSEPLSFYADLQYRNINYDIKGTDDDLRDITQSHSYNFFNPKAGLFYRPNQSHEAYISYARANREPARSDFTDADPDGKQPVAESLDDFEAGWYFRAPRFLIGANLYYMKYSDQLVSTGEVNNVGSPIMVNVDDSYRAGIELTAGIRIVRGLNLDAHATLSRNKIKNFTEYVDNWDTEAQEGFALGKTDLSFSPDVVVNSRLNYRPWEALNISLLSNYAGRQYIDNTSNSDRKLDAWFVNNLKIDYSLKNKLFKEVRLHLLVNNLFDTQYESNAWVYSYIYGGERYKMDGYFPQAGINFLAGIDIRF